MKKEQEFLMRCEIAGWVAAQIAPNCGPEIDASAVSKLSVDIAHNIVMDTAIKMKQQELNSRELSRRMNKK